MDFINKKHLLSVASCCPFSRHCNGDVARTASAGAQFSQLFELIEFVKSVSGLTAVLTELPHLISQNIEAPFNF